MKKLPIILTLILTLSLYGCGNQETEDNEAAGSSNIIDEQPNEQIKDDKAEAENAEVENTEVENTEVENTEVENVALDDTNEAESVLEYTVTPYDEAQVMYTTDLLNVRTGPSTDFERIGVLDHGKEITVTGQTDTNWYEIQYGEGRAYVSNEYVQSAEEFAAQQAVPEIQPITEVKNVSDVILVGDSRFVQMKKSVDANDCTWIAESSKGYKWFEDQAIPLIDSCVGSGSKILINLGVNDTHNLQKYITLVNAKAAEWTELGATVYYASVNPVVENAYVTEEQVEYFNTQMQNGLSSDVHWIDSHSYLTSIGYRLVDGLHYSSETYQNLYAYFMSCM